MIACLHFFAFYYPAKSIFRSKCQKLKRLFYTLRNTIFNWNETGKPTDIRHNYMEMTILDFHLSLWKIQEELCRFAE